MFFFFSSRRRHTRSLRDWSSDVCSSDLGRGLTLMQRLLFLPTHWLSLGLRTLIAIIAPIVFLWSGISPVFDVSPADVIYYFLPMVLALAGGVGAYAPGQHFP